jgi:hypothetical protein
VVGSVTGGVGGFDFGGECGSGGSVGSVGGEAVDSGGGRVVGGDGV